MDCCHSFSLVLPIEFKMGAITLLPDEILVPILRNVNAQDLPEVLSTCRDFYRLRVDYMPAIVLAACNRRKTGRRNRGRSREPRTIPPLVVALVDTPAWGAKAATGVLELLMASLEDKDPYFPRNRGTVAALAATVLGGGTRSSGAYRYKLKLFSIVDGMREGREGWKGSTYTSNLALVLLRIEGFPPGLNKLSWGALRGLEGFCRELLFRRDGALISSEKAAERAGGAGGLGAIEGLEAGESFDTAVFRGKRPTPLALAAKRGWDWMVTALLELGADVEGQQGGISLVEIPTTVEDPPLGFSSSETGYEYSGKGLPVTPLHVALENFRKGAVDLLEKAGADYNCLGNPPLEARMQMQILENLRASDAHPPMTNDDMSLSMEENSDDSR